MRPPVSRAHAHAHGAGATRRYAAPPGRFDEMVDEAGALRPAWGKLAHHVDGLSAPALEEVWDQLRLLLHDNGVSFNVYGDPEGIDRPWQLNPVPVVFSSTEFAPLADGLAQRAMLLDRLLADLYGPQRALREGWIPPELVFRHPGFLRPCHGVSIPANRYLFFYAADLVRLPSGLFHVLTDRTQAPSGAGYALENRILTSRVLPDAFRECNVERLAHFFRSMRQTLAALAPHRRDNPRIVLLSPGPYSATYFEQAFLAQYLGYMLVEGADLTVRDGHVFLKTLGGLHPVDVILRRMNDDYCDPLELRADSALGIPGLLQAVREGNVAVANALGTGLLQTPALIPFLPQLCRGLLDQELKLPSVPSWWCGDPGSLGHVLAHLDELVIKPAYPTGLTQPIFGETLTDLTRAELVAQIRAAPAAFVAQQHISPSTAPLIEPSGLNARPLVLRTFMLARHGAADAGYDVLPGGLSLVANSAEDREISIERGAHSKDTWICSGAQVSTFTLLPPPSQPVELSRGGGELPSRVADGLFWLGRYAERADAMARLARSITARVADVPDTGVSENAELAPLLAALRVHTEGGPSQFILKDVIYPSPLHELFFAVLDPDAPATLRATIRSAHNVGRVIRDRLSMDTWRILATLDQEMREAPPEHDRSGQAAASLAALLDRVVVTLAALSGVVMESMTRGQAWRFLDMGRRLERAIALVRLLGTALAGITPREGPLLEALLEVADSGMTYRRRYLAKLQAPAVVDLLLTDETNPRSVIFQVAALSEHLSTLPRDPTRSGGATEQQIVAAVLSALQQADVTSICAVDSAGRRPALSQLLAALTRDLPNLSDAVSGSYLNHATALSRPLAAGLAAGPRR
jgi:uncharacterized circularly permuted ATP-grasp superfamily protein/uncharacterized alpha-E superfamily protein